MSGFPLRPDRASFGEVLVNAAPVRDPSRQLDAAIFNLLTWQVAGLGLLAPRALVLFTAQASPPLIARAEAWNPRGETGGQLVPPTLTRNGTGDYLVTWPSPVPDENGASQTLAFSYAHAFTINTDPSVVKHAQAAPVLATPRAVRVCVFNAANALADGNDVAVFAW